MEFKKWYDHRGQVKTAVAQAPEPITGYRIVLPLNGDVMHRVMLSNGDVYAREADYTGVGPRWISGAVFLGNFWGGTVPTSNETWGAIKGEFDKKD